MISKLPGKSSFILFWLVCFSALLSAQENQIWGNLVKGKYNIGFTSYYHYDVSRPPLYEQRLLSSSQKVGRPIPINVWYPSTQKGNLISMLDYFKLTTREVDFQKDINQLDEIIKLVQQEQTNSHGVELNTAGLRSFLETNPLMKASVDIGPADGKFPLIIIGPETAFKWSLMAEYLASYGYVVVTTPMTGSTEKLPDFERTLFEKESFVKADDASISDLQFTLAKVKELPYVDNTQIGLLGYSSNISHGIGLISKGLKFDAIVSLEGAIGGFLGGEVLSMLPYHSPYKIKQPLLHIYNPAFGYDDYWVKQYKYADRMLIATYDIRHEHLTTYGALNKLIPGISGSTNHSPELALKTAYAYTLNFFNYHLKGSKKAQEFLQRSLVENKVAEEFQQGVDTKYLGIQRLAAMKTYDEYELNTFYRDADFNKIQRLYEKLSTVNPQPFSKSTFFNFGRFLKSTEEKEIWYSNYVASYPNFSEPYFLLGQEKQRLKKKIEAINNYETALALFDKTDHILLENIFSRVIKRRLLKLKQ